MAQMQFNATEHKASTDFSPIPRGRYNVMVTDSDYCETKSGNGHYLKLTFKVLDGEYANRLLWTNLNLDNPNPTAVEIAQGELTALMNACELETIDDSQELHGIPVTGQVGIQAAQGGYDASNKINGFKKLEDGNGAAGNKATEKAPW